MKFIVKHLKQKDAGRCLAAVDRVAADEIGLSGGDFVRLNSDDRTVFARVWPGYSEDDGTGIVRVDGQIRQEAGIGVDDHVIVKKAEINPAELITIALPRRLGIRGNIGPLIRRELNCQSVTAGQNVQISQEFDDQLQDIPLKIASTVPSGKVVVTDSTQVEVSENPAEQIGETLTDGVNGTLDDALDTTYEDIDSDENDDNQARHGFAQWLIYMIRVSGVEVNQLSEASDVSRDRICRLIAGEVLPTTTDVASLAKAIESVEDVE